MHLSLCIWFARVQKKIKNKNKQKCADSQATAAKVSVSEPSEIKLLSPAVVFSELPLMMKNSSLNALSRGGPFGYQQKSNCVFAH